MSLLPGLPALPLGVNIFTNAALLAADSLLSSLGLFKSQWGIYLDGFPVIVCDNVISLEFDQDFRLSKYPQEEGAFATYNKVALPFTTKVRMSTGGSLSNRIAFLQSIQDIVADTNLYDVVSPEAIYSSCNIVRQSLHRSSGDVGLVSVDVWLEQVKVAGASTFSSSKTKSPSGASAYSSGLVQSEPLPDIPTPK